MSSVIRRAAILLLLALAVRPVHAGVIDPALERHLATLPEDTQVSVIVVLANQAPLATLDAELRATGATLQRRHSRVITTLLATANATQGPLLADLTARRVRGEVRGYTPYWIANLVVAQMTAKAVREVAARPDVAEVEANFKVSLMEPVGDVGREEDPQTPMAATSGLCAIHAPRVWYELGITGAGRVVGGLDTGVMLGHAALKDRWRGNKFGAVLGDAWLDVLGTSPAIPSDQSMSGHGTHTMGTMVGLGSVTQDSIGVAWGAHWIACNAIQQNVGSEFDNDVIEAFQWFADPDGNPNTTDDVPDVVQNSWRVNETYPGGYQDCDSRWWAVIDGCEASGCAVVFSAGNEGPDPQTIGSPSDRITTPTNIFAVGAVDASVGCPSSPNIAGFSSRGPSGCDGVTKKPEVVAPGVAVRSSINNGGYGTLNGTSMAGPHVSGMFALLRQANPDLDVTTMKQIIMNTARDLGPSNEDNHFGWGMVDAYEAVLAALQTTGLTSHGAPPGRVRMVVNPNPFYFGTLVTYELSDRSRVAVRIYDLQGRLVRTLGDGTIEPGVHSAFFDGRSDAGRNLATGTYFLQVVAEGKRATDKLSLIRR